MLIKCYLNNESPREEGKNCGKKSLYIIGKKMLLKN